MYGIVEWDGKLLENWRTITEKNGNFPKQWKVYNGQFFLCFYDIENKVYDIENKTFE